MAVDKILKLFPRVVLTKDQQLHLGWKENTSWQENRYLLIKTNQLRKDGGEMDCKMDEYKKKEQGNKQMSKQKW